MPEETVDAERLVEGSTQITAVIAVGCWRVMLVVAVKPACACAAAVIVTMLLVGTVAGAVYNPPVILMDPVPVPLTDQFTRLLFVRPVMVAVH